MPDIKHHNDQGAEQRLQAAFPWVVRLQREERTRFAIELAGHAAGATDRELDVMIGRWKSIATERASRGRRSGRRAA